MKYFQVTYSNRNFATGTYFVAANNEKAAIKSAKKTEGSSRFAEPKATEISKELFLSKDVLYKDENVRF
jgi:hypothetical protein